MGEHTNKTEHTTKCKEWHKRAGRCVCGDGDFDYVDDNKRTVQVFRWPSGGIPKIGTEPAKMSSTSLEDEKSLGESTNG